jgi:hypothetical protein
MVATLKRTQEAAKATETAKDEEIRRVQAQLLERDREKKETHGARGISRDSIGREGSGVCADERERRRAQLETGRARARAKELAATIERLRARDEDAQGRAGYRATGRRRSG